MIAQKYRPRKFTDVVGQDLVKKNLMAQSVRNMWSQVYILCGQFGSGKTTLARIIAMAVNCHHKDENGNPCGKCPECRAILSGMCSDILEVDAASNTGVDNIRKLIELSGYAATVVDKRVFIIDEVHRLSAAAFESLLKLLEEPPQHCIFVLCTTDVEKIPRTVQSRACKYTFGRIPEQLISEHLSKVASVENIRITRGACDVIARASDGALRNAMMFLERVSFAGTEIDEDAVNDIIGTTNDVKTAELINSIASYKKERLVMQVHEFALVGKNFYTLIGEMIDVTSDLILDYCHAGISCSAAYREVISEFNGGLDKRARLSSFLITVREKVRDNASESTFLALLLKTLTDLQEEFDPAVQKAAEDNCVNAVREIEPQEETREISDAPDAVEKESAAVIKSEENNDIGEFGFDMFPDDFVSRKDDDIVITEDPFALFSVGSDAEKEPEAEEMDGQRTVNIPGIAMGVELEEDDAASAGKEEPDDSDVLKTDGVSGNAARAVAIINRECRGNSDLADAACASEISFNEDGVSIIPGSIEAMRILMNLTMLDDEDAEYISIEQCAANA